MNCEYPIVSTDAIYAAGTDAIYAAGTDAIYRVPTEYWEPS
jgi:hypothetical protein